MHEDLLTVIETLLWNGIRVELYVRDGVLYGQIPIGSKTGTGDLYFDGDDVTLLTRYDKRDIIDMDNILEDIAYIAWHWYLNYKDRDYGPSETWLPTWKAMGLIEERKIQKVEYIIKH